MKFLCDSNNLQKSINIVEKAISQRTTLPALENIFLETRGNQLVLRGNDLEIGIEAKSEISNSSGDSSILVKAKTISSIVSKLQNQQISISVDERNKMDIKAEKVDFDILCSPSSDYPVFPSVQKGVGFSISVENFKKLIKYTVFSVSFDETKNFLNGILMDKENDRLSFVATDGYRLSLKTHEIDSIPNNFSAIVPYKAMNEWYRIMQNIDSKEILEVNVTDKQITFKLGDIIMVSRTIEGNFPDYRNVIPKETENGFIVSRRLLLDASERASIIASESNNVVRFNFTDAQLNIVANAATMGDFNEDLSLTRTKGSGEVKPAFNIRLVLDVLKVIEDDDIKLEFNNGLSPCLVKPVLDDDYTYIIMPIRTSEFIKEETSNEEKEKVTENVT
ncbi:DNA polymerase III subunit beta [Candidatus Margulisiibacteriota bacterium]